MNIFKCDKSSNQVVRSHRSRSILGACLCMAAATLGAQNVLAEIAPTSEPLPTSQPVVASFDGDLQLWKLRDTGIGEPEWVYACTVPFPSRIPSGQSVAVRMDNNSYGCSNDDARGFKIANGGEVIIGFFDDKCTDSNMEDDDYFQYKVTKPALTTPLIKSLEPSATVAVGQEVTDGLTYHRGYRKNGIDGKLSCVMFWPVR